jgi:hypothetical protein
MKKLVYTGALLLAAAAGAGLYTCCTQKSEKKAAPSVATAAAPVKAAPVAKKQADTVPGAPWLKKVPGSTYTAPKKVSKLLYKKYSSFEESVELAKQGSGELASSEDKTGYQTNWVDPNSDLYGKIGLRKGDKVISINGQPVGRSVKASQAQFEQLKNEKSFAVLVERDGKQIVLNWTYSTEK